MDGEIVRCITEMATCILGGGWLPDLWTPLQEAIWYRLTEDPVFASLTDVNRKGQPGKTGPQYYISYIPEWAAYPYADTPGDAVARPFYEFSGGRGSEPLWPIHIWCDLESGGPLKCRQVAEAVHNALTKEDLEVPGWSPMLCELIHSTQPMRQESDPNLFHQVLRYRLMFYKL